MAKRKVVKKINNVDGPEKKPKVAENAGTGTIKSNLERYRSDDVEHVKARQGKSADTGTKQKRNYTVKEKKARRRKLIIRLCVTVFVLLVCAAGFTFTYWVFHDVPIDETNTKKIEVTISEGASDEEVGAILKEAGCIDNERLYKLRTFIYDAKYVPGVYHVSPSFTTEKIINILSGYDYTSDGLMEE